GLKMAPTEAGGGGEAVQSQPDRVPDAKPQGWLDCRQRSEQGFDEPCPHACLPVRQPPPRWPVRSERSRGQLDVAGDADTAVVGGRVGTLAPGVTPLQASAGKVEGVECRAVIGKGKESGADVMQEARARHLF